MILDARPAYCRSDGDDLGNGKYRLSVVSPPLRGGRVGLMAHHFSQKQKHRMALRFNLEKRTNAGLLLVGYHILRAEMLYYYYYG